jgi:protein-S-isoprenylcysteine O-methyltransferase Ste14
MINIIILIVTLLLLLLVVAAVGRAILMKQQIIGRPPIPVLFFILAKLCVVINLVFLFCRGIGVPVPVLFEPPRWLEIIGLVFLFTGFTVVLFVAIQMNKDLVFGLSSSREHTLQTKGLFRVSRHPFYLGFLGVLFASSVLVPNVANIIAFILAWIIHHFIMIREEQFLASQYGEQYRQYTEKVKRYISF